MLYGVVFLECSDRVNALICIIEDDALHISVKRMKYKTTVNKTILNDITVGKGT